MGWTVNPWLAEIVTQMRSQNLDAGIAQRKSGTLPTFRSRFQNSLSAPKYIGC